MFLVPRWLRDLARRKTGAEADADSAAGLDRYHRSFPPAKRVLTEEEIAQFKADFIAAVEGRWPSATIAPETSVTPCNTEEGRE